MEILLNKKMVFFKTIHDWMITFFENEDNVVPKSERHYIGKKKNCKTDKNILKSFMGSN